MAYVLSFEDSYRLGAAVGSVREVNVGGKRTAAAAKPNTFQASLGRNWRRERKPAGA